MKTFVHVTTFTAVVDGKDAKHQVEESLTVPTTMAELLAMDGGEMVDITVGKDKDAVTLSVPQVIRDYISGRKLRSNQEMQAENRPEDPKSTRRRQIEKWYGSDLTRGQDLLQRMIAARSPKQKKAHGEWLDSLYEANKAEIDAVK